MGIVASLFGGGNTGRTDDPDPITGLTSREKYLIQSSWVPVRKDPIQTGVALLILYFEKFPDELEFFPFKDIRREDLAKNKRFHAHCAAVLGTITSIVDAIDDSELVVEMLMKTANSHKMRSIPEQSFWNLKSTMIEFFSSVMSKETVAAWDKALDVIMKVIVKEF